MSEYRLTSGASIIRTSDGARIPADAANKDHVAYQIWVAAGGESDPDVAPSIPVPQQIFAWQFFQQLAVQGIISEADAGATISERNNP